MRFWRRVRHDAEEAKKARVEAERDLAVTKAETPTYRTFAAALVEVQRKNHLGFNAVRVLRGEK